MKMQYIKELIKNSELYNKAEMITSKKLLESILERLTKRIFKEIKKENKV